MRQNIFFKKSTSEIYVNFERVTFPGKQRYSRFDRFVILWQFFFHKKDHIYYLGKFFLVLFLNDETETWPWNFIFYIFGNDIAWNNGYQSIKFQIPATLKTKNTDRTFSSNDCFKKILYFELGVLWTAATLCSPLSESCALYIFKMPKTKLFNSKLQSVTRTTKIIF